MTAAGRRWYPAVALGVLAGVDGLHGFALLILGPDIARTLGVGPATISAIAVLGMLAAALASLAAAHLVAERRRRATASVALGGAWSAVSMATGVVTGPWGLAGTAAADGAATGAVQAIHPALLADVYPERRHVRALSVHRGLNAAGLVAGPAFVGVLSAAGLTWRGIFIAVGVAGLAAVAVASGLRDPSPGAPAEAGVRPTVLEQARGLLAIPTIRRLLAAFAVAGVSLAPLLSYLFFFLEDRWGLEAAGRGAFLAAAGVASVAAMALFAGPYERLAARSPSALVGGAWPLLVVAAAALLVAVTAPWFGISVAAFCAALAALALIDVPLLVLLLRLVPPGARIVATALGGIALAGVGGIGGVLLLGGSEQTLGIGGAVALLAAPALVAAMVLRSARTTADADVAHAARVAARPEAARAGAVRRARLELDAIAFAYDGRPALAAADLRVDAGELVAVLGTNGAGKSTLLRVVSGLLIPAAGSVRLDGQDVTWLSPERRAAAGIVHVPSEGASFPALTVRENLRVAALGRLAARDASAAAGAVLERQPLLAARADVPAGALSGGERRLLALAQALVLSPRVLLVDELTRGLAPGAADGMLAEIRRLNGAGMTVLLVEQSADRALALAPRAIFLEAGRIRFDGPAGDLRCRTDLLRPVHLRPSPVSGLAVRETSLPDGARSAVIPPGKFER